MRSVRAVVVAALVMVVVDLVWLGVFAASFYNEQLGPLRAQETVAVLPPFSTSNTSPWWSSSLPRCERADGGGAGAARLVRLRDL